MPTVRYVATLHGHTEQVAVEVEDKGAGQLVLLLDGKRHAVDALGLEHGAVSLLVDGQVYDVEFDDVGEEVQVQVRGDVFCVDVADERSLRLRAGATTLKVEGRVTLSAPMPGKVVRVLVKKGESVQEGRGWWWWRR
jgi:acetyl/propionyl-CoA carboxylase alpha subunit